MIDMEKELTDYLAAVEKDFEDHEATLQQESVEDECVELLQEAADIMAEDEDPAAVRFADYAERYEQARFGRG